MGKTTTRHHSSQLNFASSLHSTLEMPSSPDTLTEHLLNAPSWLGSSPYHPLPPRSPRAKQPHPNGGFPFAIPFAVNREISGPKRSIHSLVDIDTRLYDKRTRPSPNNLSTGSGGVIDNKIGTIAFRRLLGTKDHEGLTPLTPSNQNLLTQLSGEDLTTPQESTASTRFQQTPFHYIEWVKYKEDFVVSLALFSFLPPSLR